MYLIKFIFLCFGAAFIGASLFRLRFEKSLAIFLLGIIVTLYQAYILNIVSICSTGIIAGMVVGGGSGITKIIRDKTLKETMKKVFTPLAVSYVITLCIIWYVVRFNQVRLIDELHLWGALPKILFFEKGKQQLTDSLLLAYNDYIPGMPLFLYFLGFINGSFKEALLYFGYAAVGAILLMGGMFEKLSSYKRWYFIPVASVITFFLPLMYYNNIFNDHAVYYKSLHVDAALGIFAAYATWKLSKRCWRETAGAVCFSLSLTVIVLLKSSGIMYVAIIGFAAFFYIAIKDKKYVKRIAIILMMPFMAYFEWAIFLKVKKVELTVADYSVRDIFSSKYLGEFAELLCRRELIYQPRMEETGRFSTFLWLFIVLGILAIAASLMIKKTYVTYVNGVMIFQVIIFTAGVYGLFAGPFKGLELSYARYICTALTAFQCYLAMLLLNNINLLKKECLLKKRNIFLLVIPILFLAVLFPRVRPQEISYPVPALRDADEFEKLINHLKKGDTTNQKKILLVIDKEYNSFSPDLYLYFWRRLYFDLIDENEKVAVCKFTDEYIDEMKESNEEIEMHLQQTCETEDFDYIYKVNYISDTEKKSEIFRVKNRTKDTYYIELIEQKK